MSDLFHRSVTLDFVQKAFAVMNDTAQHTYQLLTKRAEILAQFAPHLVFTPNIWVGVCVEDNRVIERIDHLHTVDAEVRSLSLEPLIGPLSNLDLTGIHWAIVGGESGRKARPMQRNWVEDIRLQCKAAGVKFFFKQWGGKNKKQAGRILNVRTYAEADVKHEQLMQSMILKHPGL